jgi:hypothetical protein
VDVGDYIEFLAEIDLLVSASTCPQGDVSIACGDSSIEPTVYPLGVEVYKLTDPTYLQSKGWQPSPVNGYCGNHGVGATTPITPPPNLMGSLGISFWI